MRDFWVFKGIMTALYVMCITSARPIDPDPDSHSRMQVNALEYLQKFGYIQATSLRLFEGKTATLNISDAVKDFQDFAGLEVTGRLDSQTLDLMSKSRCGVPDKHRDSVRFRRFVTHSSKWPRHELKYFINSYPDDSILSTRQIDKIMAKAFHMWSEASDLSFDRTFSQAEADINLDFFYGKHGNDEAFDGRGGVLAHAFYPRFGGDVHFDSAEDWLDDKIESRVQRGAKQLLQTAVHEIGHSLGLSHSRDRRAIMAPFYLGWIDNLQLRSDDIEGIQAIYGKTKTNRRPKEFTPRPTTTTTTSTTSKPQLINDDDNDQFICANPRFDALTETANGAFYAFKGNYYWKLKTNEYGYEPGYPRPTTDWAGLPGPIDAAFFNPKDRMTYIFKDHQVGKYHNLELQSGYPKSISSEFPGIPSNMDASLLWGRNQQLYIFKGSQYWKLDLNSRRVESGYPKKIQSNWKGVPNNVDAAIKWKNGKSFFFKDHQYYRFDDHNVKVDQSHAIKYPRSISKYWLDCDAKPQVDIVTDSERQPRWRWY